MKKMEIAMRNIFKIQIICREETRNALKKDSTFIQKDAGNPTD
jgi:hypothetical protein